MAQENITIKLPVSGSEAVIRSYLRRKDEKVTERTLYGGQSIGVPIETGSNGTVSAGNGYDVKFSMDKIGDLDDMQILTLLISLDGKTELTLDDIEELHIDDYRLLLEETNKVFGDKRIDKRAERSKK